MYAIIDIDPDYANVKFGTEEKMTQEFETLSTYKSEGSLTLVRVDDPSNFSFYNGRGAEVTGGEIIEEWES